MKNQQFLIRKQKAADFIARHLKDLEGDPHDRNTCQCMVQVFRILTGEMPMVEDLHLLDLPLEDPAVEFVSPNEREPGDIYYIHPGLGGDPDILIQGDQHGEEEGRIEEGHQEEDITLLKDPQGRQERLRLAAPIGAKPDDETEV